MMYDSGWCLDVKILQVFPAGHGCAVTGQMSAARSLDMNSSVCPWNCWLSWHTRATKYQCTPLRVKELVVHRTPSLWRVTAEGRSGRGEGGGRRSSSTGQTVSERRRGSVTYCFTGKLPDLLGVKARSSLVYTQPWISAWNMSTSSQPISHRGGAVWAADTSRFPRTMRPIPHARPRSVCDWRCGDRHRQRHSTAPLGHRTVPLPWGPASDSGSLSQRWRTLSAKQ